MRSDHLFISETEHTHSIPIQDFTTPNNALLLTKDDPLNKRIQVKEKSQVKPSQEKSHKKQDNASSFFLTFFVLTLNLTLKTV